MRIISSFCLLCFVLIIIHQLYTNCNVWKIKNAALFSKKMYNFATFFIKISQKISPFSFLAKIINSVYRWRWREPFTILERHKLFSAFRLFYFIPKIQRKIFLNIIKTFHLEIFHFRSLQINYLLLIKVMALNWDPFDLK